MNAITKEVEIHKINLATATTEIKQDIVAQEAPLHIFVGAIHYVSILCSPTMQKELVIGHLLSEAIMNSIADVASIYFDKENRCRITLRNANTEERIVISKPFARLIVSACGSGSYGSISELLDTIEWKPLPSWQIKAKTILECVKRLNVLADVFRKTGGVHVAALFKSDGETVAMAEDVGRHNAVDKVIGAAALKSEDLAMCFLALSGRLTGDIVLKAARVGIPIVASLAAAVDSGVKVAEKAGLTLAGFVRGNKMNVYTNIERIKF